MKKKFTPKRNDSDRIDEYAFKIKKKMTFQIKL